MVNGLDCEAEQTLHKRSNQYSAVQFNFAQGKDAIKSLLVNQKSFVDPLFRQSVRRVVEFFLSCLDTFCVNSGVVIYQFQSTQLW